MATIELWEDNAGGLHMTRGAEGWHGIERLQNEPRYRAMPRTEATFEADARAFDDLDGAAYERTDAADVARLREQRGEVNAAVLVATCTGGWVSIHREVTLGAAARWYLCGDYVSDQEDA